MASKKKKTVKKTVAKKAAVKKPAVKKTVAKKPVAKKPAVKKAVTKKPALKKKPVKKAAASNSKIKVTPEQLHKMICEAAYYISLDRTSETVHPTQDWLQAETAINKICSL